MKKIKIGVMSLLAVLVLALSASVFAADVTESETQTETEGNTRTEKKGGSEVKELVKDELNVKAGTMVSNFFSFGTSLSGLDKEETQKAIAETRENIRQQKLHATSADEDKEWEATLEELGVKLESADISEQLNDAYLTGSLLTRYKKAKAYEKNPVNLISGMVMDEEKILEKVQEALKDWDQEKKESTAHLVDGVLEVVEGQYGHTYDFAPGVEKFVKALKEGTLYGEDFELECEYTTEEPILTPEKVKEFTVIGSCTTGYSKPTTDSLKGRETNLIKGIGNANGRVYAPGEIVSMLEIYGEVSVANGYGIAGTYNPTRGHIEEVGGGLCQVASTMYNAALMAELEIVHREPHNYMVAYLPPSLDAMIYAKSKNDFKFKNSSSDYIIIDASVDRANQYITINIIGHEDHAPGHSVTYYSVIDGEINMPQSTNKVDEDMKIGFGGDMFVADDDWFVAPSFVSTSYKVTMENGVVVKEEVLNHDRYNPCNQNVIYVPADKFAKVTAIEGYANGGKRMYIGSSTNTGYKANFIQIDTYFVGEDGNSASDYLYSGKSFNYSDLNATVKAGMAARGYSGWTAEGDQKQGVAKAIVGVPEESTEEESSSESESSEQESSSAESSGETD